MKDGKYVVLCVDDDPDVVAGLRALLEANGYVAEAASTGQEALDRYDEVKPDFLIIDLMMETLEAGAELAKKLKAKEGSPPMYMLSSIGGELGELSDPQSVGVDGILEKPMKPNVILQALKNHLK